MSIDWLWDLDRAVEGGRVYFTCQSLGKDQWAVAKTLEELTPLAKRVADSKKIPVEVFRIIPPNEAIAGDLFLVPREIGDPGFRGEPNVKWVRVGTREDADTWKDVRKGPAPIFGIQVEETVEPSAIS